MWAMGLPGFLARAGAEQLVELSDTLSTSRPGVGADHTIRFTTPSGILADGSTIDVIIPSGFNVSTITANDVEISDDAVDLTVGATCGAVQAAVSVSIQTITVELCSGGTDIVADSIVVIKVGQHTASGTNRIINHSEPGSYELELAGTMPDDGRTRIVIVEPVLVSGAVATFLSFDISGVAAGESINGDTTTTFATTTATSLAFGIVQATNEYLLAQNLSVTTNTREGFVVTVEAAGNLESSSGASISSFIDGNGTAVPGGWVPPSAQSGSSTTYGHWGLTTEDTSLTDGASFDGALYAGNFISEPREVMYHDGAADGSTPGVGATRVGYKLEISGLQEAGSDYTTRLIYVVTPTF
jgi:hypothetical protein